MEFLNPTALFGLLALPLLLMPCESVAVAACGGGIDVDFLHAIILRVHQSQALVFGRVDVRGGEELNNDERGSPVRERPQPNQRNGRTHVPAGTPRRVRRTDASR